MQVKLAILLLMLFISGCSVSQQDNEAITLFEYPGYNFPYRLSRPDHKWELPGSLVEISGLSVIDTHRLACVQDEKGIIFIFNTTTGKVEQEITFGEPGDHEGIEIIGRDAWILKSNGTLYRVPNYLEPAGTKAVKYSTALSGKNDAEGLAYDPVDNNLLIACKGHPFLDDSQDEGFRAAYSFNLETRMLDSRPFLLIDIDPARHQHNNDNLGRAGADIQAHLDPSLGVKTFQPSGIAVHPATGDIYIMASAGKLLFVVSRRGEMLAVIKLDSGIFPKPEGICFSPDGTLYISSEGALRTGTIAEFRLVN